MIELNAIVIILGGVAIFSTFIFGFHHWSKKFIQWENKEHIVKNDEDYGDGE